MISDSYNYLSLENKTVYFFESDGEQGKIIKIVVFESIDETLWNLAFGDFNEGTINDSIVSNNNDIVKLIGTIAKIVYEFSVAFPLRQILIKPVDEKRKKLYNHVFRRHLKVINQSFVVKGTFLNQEEDYSPEIFYDNFRIIRKFVK
jgi:hypothetical protein